MQSTLTFFCFHNDCKSLFSRDSDHLTKNPSHKKKLKQIPDLLLKRYEFIQCLGSGAFASVFKVYDNLLESNYALKVCLLELDGCPEIQEFKTMSAIKHPNIIQFYDVHILTICMSMSMSNYNQILILICSSIFFYYFVH